MANQRRGKGEGSVIKRPDGRYMGVVSLGYEDGKRKRRYIYGEKRGAVIEEMRRVQREAQMGTLPTDDSLTVAVYLWDWLENWARPSVKVSTYVSYEVQVRKHLVPGLGHIPLGKLTPQHVRTFLGRMASARTRRGRPYSARSAMYAYAVLRRALSQAVKLGVVTRNVALLVDPPRVPRNEVVPFTPQQARQLLDAVRGDRLEAYYSVAISMGLRRGEALGLMWSDIDFEAGTLSVRRTLQRARGVLRLDEPKTAASVRTLRLPRSIAAALRSHLVRQKEDKLRAGVIRWRDNGLVFCTRWGTPIEPRNLNRHFDRVMEKAGLPHFRVHDMRHTCASLLLAQGVSMKTVQTIMGHSSFAVTANVYGHIFDEAKQEAADRMDDFLEG